MKKLKFEELSLSHEIAKAVADMGFEEATPIQSLSIPHILNGKDVIGQAQTGTGKTAAFGIPILEAIDAKNPKPQSIILCPTRELAIQVAEELKRLAKYKKGIVILPVYGGQPIDRQIHALRKGVQIIIGTPGRVMDHLDRRTLRLDGVKIVVLDEADEMLDMGFRDDIEIILKNVPVVRQTVFFSATMPKPFLELTKKYQKHPVIVKVVHDKLTVPNVEQSYFEVKEGMKMEMLSRVIDVYDPKLALVFCNTKRKVDEVVSHLQARGYFADGIHGDMNQGQRDRVMAKFRKGAVEILVATDVAARGIDVENVDAVINYDAPQDEEYYVHRIGRTARAGKSGHAFTFVSGRDIYKIRDIQRYAKVEIKRKIVPSQKDVENIRASQFLDKVKEEMNSPDIGKYIGMIERLIEPDVNTLDIAAALLKMNIEKSSASKETKAGAGKVYPADAQNEPYTNTGPKKHFKHGGENNRSHKASYVDYGDTGAEAGMVRIFINVGRAQNIGPGDIVGAIAGEVGVPGKSIGKIDMHDRFSFVEVSEADAGRIISVMRSKQIKGNKINMEAANKK
ncbi:MAG: DEAD/DEAH box helicase [Elusimicrobiota bacterium]